MPADVFRIQGVVEVVADRAQRTLVVFRNAAAQTANSIKNNFAGLDKVLGGFSGFFTGLQFKRLADGMIQASIKSETFRTQMGLIVKDMEKVKDLTNFVEKYEARTPFDLPELQKATVLFTKLTKVREESIEKVPEYLKLAGEMAAIFDKPLSKATEGLFKTFSGSALGLTILRNNFAITKAELEKFGVAFDKSGRIKNFQLQIGTVEKAISSIIGHLSGFKLAEARSQTLFGRMETLGSEVYRTARAFGDAMAPAAMLIIDRLIDLNQAVQALDPTVKSIIAGFVGLGAVMGTMVITFGPIFYFTNQLIQSFRELAIATSLAAASGVEMSMAGKMMQVAMLPIPALLGRMWASFVLFGQASSAFFVTSSVQALRWSQTIGAAYQSGTLFATLGKGFSSVGSSLSGMVSTTGLLRFGLYGLGAAALIAAANMNALTQARLKDVEANEQLLTENTPRDLHGGDRGQVERGGANARVGALAEAMGYGPKKPFKQYGPQNPAAAEKLEADIARIEAMLAAHPEVSGAANKGFTAAGLEERIKSHQARLKTGTRGNQVAPLDPLESAMLWLTGNDPTEGEQKAKAAKEAKALLDREAKRKANAGRTPLNDTVGGSRAGSEPGGGFGPQQENDVAPAASAAEIKKAQETLRAYEAESQGLGAKIQEGLKKELKQMMELLPMLKDREKLYGIKESPSEIIGAVDEINKAKKTGDEDLKKSITELHELKLKTLDKEGKVTVEYAEANEKVRIALYDRTTKLGAQYVDQIKDQAAQEESIGELSLDRKMELIVQERQALQKAAEEGRGTMTKSMVKQDRDLLRDWNKLALEKKKTNEALEIETTRITQGEAAARLMEIQKEYDGRKLAGADEGKLRIWWDDQVKKNMLANFAEEMAAARALTDARMEAASIRAGTRTSKANYDMEHGTGSFGDIRDANANQDGLDQQAADIKLQRDIQDAKKADEARDKGVASTLKKQIAAIKERYEAEKAAREEDHRQRDADIETREKKKASDETIGRGEINRGAYDAQLEDLYTRQGEGSDVNADIQRVLRDRYQNEVAIIRAKAEAAKMNVDAAEQRRIEMQATQDILKVTRDMTAEMAKQIAMKKAAEDKKKNTSFFGNGAMSAEDYDALQKQRDAETRQKYQDMVGKERRRAGGVSEATRDAANKLGIPSEVQDQVFNPVNVKVEPIQVDVNLTLTEPGGRVTTIRRQTSTDQKNEDTKTPQSTRGGPPQAPSRRPDPTGTRRPTNTMGD